MKIETPKLWPPKTGQVTSYAAGDDGYFQAGNPRATRFIDNGNGTISDRATGLTWVKQPELMIPGASVSTLNQALVAHGSWATSHAYIIGDLVADADGSQSTQYTISAISKAALGVATTTAAHGLSSGQTILIAGCTDGTFAACDGTRTVTVTSTTEFTFGVDTSGFTTYNANSGKINQVKYYVCSAGHTSDVFATDIAADRFRLTVWTGSATNLTTQILPTWANAVAWSLALEYAGFADWRLPNMTELVSLIDWSASSGDTAATTPLFTNLMAWDGMLNRYWSATTYSATPTNAWFVSFRADYNVKVYAALKTSAICYVRPVRGGRINANW